MLNYLSITYLINDAILMKYSFRCHQGNGDGKDEVRPQRSGLSVRGGRSGGGSHGVVQPDTPRLQSMCAVFAGVERSTPASGGR